MKLIKYLVPLWIGVVIYCLLSICFGSKGFYAFRQLENEKNRENENINLLAGINRDLGDTRDLLAGDKSNYLAYARELGFAASGESFIRIIGLGNSVKSVVSPGQVVSPVTPDYIPDKILQIFSFFISVTLIISIATYDFLQYVKVKEAKIRRCQRYKYQ